MSTHKGQILKIPKQPTTNPVFFVDTLLRKSIIPEKNEDKSLA